MSRADLERSIRNHPVVIGARLDGHKISACEESGNVIIQYDRVFYEKLREDWENGELEEKPSRWKKLLHPSQASVCDGLTCTHRPILKLKRIRDLERVKETLEAHRKPSAVDPNQ